MDYDLCWIEQGAHRDQGKYTYRLPYTVEAPKVLDGPRLMGILDTVILELEQG
jgi:hypothetical protein